jgi:hypothetical protein
MGPFQSTVFGATRFGRVQRDRFGADVEHRLAGTIASRDHVRASTARPWTARPSRRSAASASCRRVDQVARHVHAVRLHQRVAGLEPIARKNVHAIAPPMSSRPPWAAAPRSRRSCPRSCCRRAPRRTDARGLERAAEVREFALHEQPRHGRTQIASATPAVLACARCAAPKASFTYRSPSSANCCASAASFFSSPAKKRVFSSSSTLPSAPGVRRRHRRGPTVSGRNCTTARRERRRAARPPVPACTSRIGRPLGTAEVREQHDLRAGSHSAVMVGRAARCACRRSRAPRRRGAR